jgi:hypothetical protein
MSTTTLPNRTAAVAALQRASQTFNRYAGPGEWTVDGRGRNFIALIFTCRMADLPDNFTGDDPWDRCGGEDILASAHLGSDRTMSGNDSGYFFASAIIFVAE